jgi:hypothetical protein
MYVTKLRFFFKWFVRLIGLLACSMLLFMYFPFVSGFIFKPKITEFPTNYKHTLNPKFNFRQSLNNCASFATAAAFNVFEDNKKDPQKIADEIGFRLKDRFTLPLGIENYFRDNNYNVEQNNLINQNEIEKINYLKSNLSQNKVGIIIIKLPNTSWYYLHYITILGYDNEDFYIYDSLATKDKNNPQFTLDLNGDLPGNKSMKSDELIKMWDDGNILNYPKNYNIFVSPK